MSGSRSPQDAGLPRAERVAPSRETLAVEDGLSVAALLSLQRLAQQSTLYLTENEAQRRALDQVSQSVGEYGAATGRTFTLLFSDRAVYVGRRLLRASRAIYATAQELRSLLGLLGATEISVSADVTLDELRALQAAFRDAQRERKARSSLPVLSHIQLRVGRLPSEVENFEALTPDQQAIRSYALAVVVMRRFLEALQGGISEIPRHLRRVALQLVQLSERATPELLAATVARTVHDDAGRAINATLLALCMARQLTDDKRVLLRVAFGSMLCDAGIPRVAALEPDEGVRVGLRLPALGLAQVRELPAATAVVTTALGKLTDAGIVHSVLVHEAVHLRYRAELGEPYAGHHRPTLLGRIIAAARRFQELLSDPDCGEERTVDLTLGIIGAEARRPVERQLLRLLASALGAFPRDSEVELSNGQRAQVVLGPQRPFDVGRPVVRVLTPAGEGGGAPELLDLAAQSGSESPLRIVRLVTTPAEAGPAASAEAPLPAMGQPRTRISVPAAGSERVTFRPPRAAAAPEAATIPPSTDLPQITDTGPIPAEVGPEQPDAPAAGARVLAAATSHGTLGKTPLVHLLVYGLDNGLAGTLLLGDPAPELTGIHLRDGVPHRVRTPADVAPLEDMLDEMGVLIDEQLSARLLSAADERQPAEALVADGLVSEPILREAFARQLTRRLGYLLTLDPATSYAYYEGVDLLGGGVSDEGPACDPLALIMRGARIRAGDPQVAELLRQVGDRPLRLHPAADPSRLGLDGEEQAVAAELRAGPPSFPALLERWPAQAQVVRATVYALLITRFIDLSGGARAPVGLRSR
jgi:hypothetical protein